MSTERRPLHAALLAALLAAPAAFAASDDPFRFELHGFATQGYVKTDANSFFGDSENGSFDFREIGVNLALEPTARLRLSGQLLSRRAGEMYSGSPEVDFLLADYTLASTDVGTASLIAGRIKNPLGIYNETRDVAFTRPGVFVPQEVYFDKVRNLIMSSDGVALAATWYPQDITVDLHLAVAQPRVDDNIEAGFLGQVWQGDLEPTGASYVANLSFATARDRLKAGFSLASTRLRFTPGPADMLTSGEIDILYTITSLQYLTGNWTFTTEYMMEPVDWDGFTFTPFENASGVAEGYYAQAQWQASERFELMLRYGEAYADRSDRSGRRAESDSGGFLPAHSRYSRILSVGARWDFSPNLMLRAEIQNHDGSFVLSTRENPRTDLISSRWTLFALSLSYRF